jgi:hypothetical protein
MTEADSIHDITAKRFLSSYVLLLLSVSYKVATQLVASRVALSSIELVSSYIFIYIYILLSALDLNTFPK